MSRISVCVPLFNGADYIEALLESLQAQTFTDFTVWIGNDVSTDHSVALVQPYLSDPRFRWIDYETNGGFFKNIVRLIRESGDTDYFLLPGQDDFYAPEFLETHLTFLDAKPLLGLVHSRSIFVDENSRDLGLDYWYWARLQAEMSGQNLLEAIFTHDFLVLPATLIRRTAFNEVRAEFLATAYTYTPDWNLWMLLAARGWGFGYLDHPDCFYRIHSRQLTQTMSSEQKTYELSSVVANVAALLGDGKYGDFLARERISMIRYFANARLLRRGLAMCLKGGAESYGTRMLSQALRSCPSILPRLPYSTWRYLLAKRRQHPLCAGLIELLHPVGAAHL